VFTARYGLIPYMKHVTFRLLKVNCVLLMVQCKGQKDGSVDVTRRLADVMERLGWGRFQCLCADRTRQAN
jgi:hypothetical protein